MLRGDERLPADLETTGVFQVTQNASGIVTAIAAVNERQLTGVYQQAAYLSKQTTFSSPRLVLDFVLLLTTDREMRRVGQTMEQNPSGAYISNTNPRLRTFAFARDGKVSFLRGATPVTATWQRLDAALNGSNVYSLSWDSYFQATISDLTDEVFKLEQGYTP
jgi:hypothetical protein